MKNIARLLIALGVVSIPALAQVHSAPQPSPAVESSGEPATSGSASGTSVNSSSGASGPMHSEAGADLKPPPSPIARLKPTTHEGVTYMCGGVGEEESNYMKKVAKNYDMMLTFATRKGAYLADVDVDISDAKGNSVLQLACDSPILLVDLPKGGAYKVRAEAAGYTLNKTVKVAGGRRQSQYVASSILSWPQKVAEGGASPTSTGGGSGGERESGNGAR
jgi:hypothetical protein